MVNETALIVAGTLAALCGLVWYLGVRRAIRSVGRPRHGRPGDFWTGWAARIIVLLLILGMGTLIFGSLILRALSALVTGTE
jgi:hypothetical protein